MFNLEEKTQDVIEYINFLLARHSGKINKIELGIFSENFKTLGIEKSVFFMILSKLEKQGFVKDVSITDLDGGTGNGNNFVPWFVDDTSFPGFYTFGITKKMARIHQHKRINHFKGWIKIRRGWLGITLKSCRRILEIRYNMMTGRL